jgi:hypothetical protein
MPVASASIKMMFRLGGFFGCSFFDIGLDVMREA